MRPFTFLSALNQSLAEQWSASANWTIGDLHVSHRTLSSAFWVYSVALAVVGVPGLLCNAMAVLALSRPSLRRIPICVLLLALCIFDSLLLLCMLLVYPPLAYCKLHSARGLCRLSSYPLLVSWPFSLCAQFGSAWMCVTIAVERYLSVSQPIKCRRSCTVPRARLFVIVVAFASVAFNFPAFFEFQSTNSDAVVSSHWRQTALYGKLYRSCLYLLAVVIIPAVVCIVFAFMTMFEISQASKLHRSVIISPSNSVENQAIEHNAALTGLLFIASFLTFTFLFFLTNLIEAAQPRWRLENETSFATLVYLGNFMIALNCSVPLLLLHSLGIRFRRELRLLLCCGHPYKGYRPVAEQTSGIISMRRLGSVREQRERRQREDIAPVAQRSSDGVVNGLHFDYSQLRASQRFKVDQPQK